MITDIARATGRLASGSLVAVVVGTLSAYVLEPLITSGTTSPAGESVTLAFYPEIPVATAIAMVVSLLAAISSLLGLRRMTIGAGAAAVVSWIVSIVASSSADAQGWLLPGATISVIATTFAALTCVSAVCAEPRKRPIGALALGTVIGVAAGWRWADATGDSSWTVFAWIPGGIGGVLLLAAGLIAVLRSSRRAAAATAVVLVAAPWMLTTSTIGPPGWPRVAEIELPIGGAIAVLALVALCAAVWQVSNRARVA